MPFFCNVILKISKSVTLQVRILKNNILSITVGDFCPDVVSFFLDGPECFYDKQRDNDSTDPVAAKSL